MLYFPGSDLSFVGTTDAGEVLAAAALSATGGLEPDVAPGALLVEDALSATVAALGYEVEGGTGGNDRIKLLLDVTGGNLAASFGSRGTRRFL